MTDKDYQRSSDLKVNYQSPVAQFQNTEWTKRYAKNKNTKYKITNK